MADDNVKNAQLFFSLVNSEVRMWDAVECAFRRAGLPVTLGRFILMTRLAEKPMRLQELTECCRAKESATSRIVNRMIKDGLVAKEADEHDRRAVILHLTSRGVEAERQAREVFESCLGDLLACFTPEQRRLLISTLGSFAAGACGDGAQS